MKICSNNPTSVEKTVKDYGEKKSMANFKSQLRAKKQKKKVLCWCFIKMFINFLQPWVKKFVKVKKANDKGVVPLFSGAKSRNC